MTEKNVIIIFISIIRTDRKEDYFILFHNSFRYLLSNRAFHKRSFHRFRLFGFTYYVTLDYANKHRKTNERR